MEKMAAAGFAVYVVGGSVRDFLSGKENHDWDFTTDATPEQIMAVFPESFYDNAFGTVGVKMADGEIFEITTFRKEGKYSDRRHPDEVSWGKTVEEDLARRDFTVNAMAMDLKDHLIDPFGGQTDLRNKVIKAVGNPEDRFSEDALRMIRAVRLATQLCFTIDEATFLSIKENASLITKISGERVRDEMTKILSAKYPADGVKLLYNAGLLDYLLPELARGVGMKQPGHHIHDVFTHSLEALRFCKSSSWLVRLATLIHDIGKPATYKEFNGKPTFYNHEVVGAAIAKTIAARWHLSKDDREKLYILVRWHMFTVSELLTDAAIRRFIKRVGKENVADMLDLRIADRLGSGSRETSWRLEQFKDRIIEVQKHIPSVTDLKVNGNDVMQTLGIGPGPKVGKILNKLFEEITENPEKNERDYLLKRAEQLG